MDPINVDFTGGKKDDGKSTSVKDIFIPPEHAGRKIAVCLVITVVLAAVLAVAPFFHKFRFWALLPAACSFVALGILFNGGAAVIMDRINNVVYSGGNFDSVVTLFILTAAACLLCIVACFMGTERRSA